MYILPVCLISAGYNLPRFGELDVVEYTPGRSESERAAWVVCGRPDSLMSYADATSNQVFFLFPFSHKNTIEFKQRKGHSKSSRNEPKFLSMLDNRSMQDTT